MHFANLPRKLAVAVLLANLAGCAALPGASNTSSNTASVLSGELTSRSQTNVNDGSRYQVFPLNLNAGQAMDVKLNGHLEAKISLLDDQQRLVNGPGTGSLLIVPEQSGRHFLNVSGVSASAFGPFSLNLTPVNSKNSGPLAVGERVAGSLNSDKGNQYQLQISEAAIYRISLSSDTLDTVLQVSGANLDLENDDADEGTNSRVDSYLKPGTYTLTAKALDNNPKGTYLIGVEQRPTPQGVEISNGGTLEAGTTITGLGGTPAVSYSLRITEPTLVTLTMRSKDLDAHLTLNGNGVDLSDDDGAGQGTDSRLSTILEAGTYKVDAGAVNNQSGLFTLEYQTQPVTAGNPNSLRPGQYANSSLRNSSGATASLHIERAGTYQIDASSKAFDAYLTLEGNGVSAEDDDSGGSLNARLTLDLDPGVYNLLIKSADGNNNGRFRISAVELD